MTKQIQTATGHQWGVTELQGAEDSATRCSTPNTLTMRDFCLILLEEGSVFA